MLVPPTPPPSYPPPRRPLASALDARLGHPCSRLEISIQSVDSRLTKEVVVKIVGFSFLRREMHFQNLRHLPLEVPS